MTSRRLVSLLLAIACASCLAACLAFRTDYFFGIGLALGRWPLSLMLLACAFRIRQRVLTAAICVAVTALTVGEYVISSAARAEPAVATGPGRPLRVITHNVLFQGFVPQQSLDMLAATPADLIAVQEVTTAWETDLDRTLLPLLPHRAARAHPSGFGYAVYSRYPLADVVYLTDPKGLPFAQCFTLELPERRLPVCNVHLASPAGALMHRGAERLALLEANAARRGAQWAQLEAHFGPARHRLALGDLNTLELEPLYTGTIAPRWVDAFRTVSNSPGATWPNHMRRRVPFARIDYVLTSGALSASSAQVLADSGSDHLAVTAELRLP